MTATQTLDEIEDGEIRAVSLDRLTPSPRAPLLTFVPRMSDAAQWQRLRAVDPRGAAMIETAFRKLYALHFPDE